MSEVCPCQSGQELEACCEPYIKGTTKPPTAESLMRSRYTAYVIGDVEYIAKTLAPESRSDFDLQATKQWAKESEWKGLKIVSTSEGQESDKRGIVEFIATYAQKGKTHEHREISTFRKSDKGQWLFVEGDERHHETMVREEPKIGRNDPCTCGSGKKYKKCCGAH